MSTEKHIATLGLRVKDRVTGFAGVVTSVTFDLYGCIQALVHPGTDGDGKIMDQAWFDIARLEIVDHEPVMRPPNFEHGPQANGEQGPAEKPASTKA